MFDFIPLHSYTPVYYWTVFLTCMLTSLYYLSNNGCTKLMQQNTGSFAFLFALLITLYIGYRPLSGLVFGDMGMYTHGYRMSRVDTFSGFFNFESEWFFEFIMKTCKKIFTYDISQWFFIVELFYVGCQTWACKKLLKENLWMALLFVCFSYQFFTFGTNGLRNGMGCAIMMLAIAYFSDKNFKGYIFGSFLFLLAMGCHRSVMIPMAALILSLFFVKRLQTAVWIWIGCVLLSVFTGSFFSTLFSSLGFDDRMSSYSAGKLTQFAHSGFRWDFLLYSSMPLILIYYVMKRKVEDRAFNVLANTYLIANAFWVLICRVSFSNRFAYLSWFLYGLVLAYAVIRLPLFKDQDRMAGWTLFANSAFTMFMFLIGK